jgi:hypothetical protein
MSKKEQLQFISNKIRKETILIGDMLTFIEKHFTKSEMENVYYISDQEVGKATYYMFMFDFMWAKKNKPLDSQSGICIKYFYDLFTLLRRK